MSEIQITSINGMGAITDLGGGSFSTTGMEANDHMHISEDFLDSAGVVGSGDYAVAQASVPGKKVTVSGGTVYVLNSNYSALSLSEQKFWRAKMGGDTDVTITDNTSGNPRIDIICLKVDATVTPDGEATNVASLVAIAGTPAASPTAPAVPDDHLLLAQVAVANGFASITTANITDKRTFCAVNNSLGWIQVADTWAYASADAPTFVITIPAGGLLKYSVGQKIRLTQTTVKYFIITAVADTTLTVYGGTDYTLTNATITNPCFSMLKAPFGFPLNPAKWSVVVTDVSSRQQSSPSAATWYNLGSVSISLPIGNWNVGYIVTMAYSYTSTGNVLVTLSTANNSESDNDLTVYSGLTLSGLYGVTLGTSKLLLIASKTVYYLNTQSGYAVTNIYNLNNVRKLTIQAICAYL